MLQEVRVQIHLTSIETFFPSKAFSSKWIVLARKNFPTFLIWLDKANYVMVWVILIENFIIITCMMMINFISNMNCDIKYVLNEF